MRWTLKKTSTEYDCIPFTVEKLHLQDAVKQRESHYYRLACPDFVNVLPITTDGKAILIRQDRAGSLTSILETPGGLVDPHEKDTTMAAARELEEETGFVSQRILPLGSINPNPGIMSNKCHYFLALGCQLTTNRQHFPDEEEHIQVEAYDAKELDELVRTGQVDHSLSALCILLAQKYINLTA